MRCLSLTSPLECVENRATESGGRRGWSFTCSMSESITSNLAYVGARSDMTQDYCLASTISTSFDNRNCIPGRLFEWSLIHKSKNRLFHINQAAFGAERKLESQMNESNFCWLWKWSGRCNDEQMFALGVSWLIAIGIVMSISLDWARSVAILVASTSFQVEIFAIEHSTEKQFRSDQSSNATDQKQSWSRLVSKLRNGGSSISFVASVTCP